MASSLKIQEELGAGAFGKVHKATRHCAVKIIDIGHLTPDEREKKKTTHGTMKSIP